MQIDPFWSDPDRDAHAVESQTLPLVQEPKGNADKSNEFLKIYRNKTDNSGHIAVSDDTNFGLALPLLDYRDNLFGWLFGDVLVVPQPGDLGVRRAGDVGVNFDLFALLNAQSRLHTCVQRDLRFF